MLSKQRKPERPAASINVTPFIDILLVLLVIFMTITPIAPKGFSADLPSEPPPGERPTQDNKSIVISIDASGSIHVNQTDIELSALGPALRDIFKARNDRTAFVQADPDLLFDQIVKVIDIGKAAGIDRIGLMTAPIGK